MGRFFNEKTLRIFLAFISLFIVASIVFFCLNLHYEVKHVEYEGLTRYTEKEMNEKVLAGFCGRYTITLRIKEKLGKNEVIPYIESYEITATDSNSLLISVHEKKLVGCFDIMGEFLFFDKDGIALESSTERIENIPVVSGLEYNEIRLNKKIKISKEYLFDTVLKVTKLLQDNELGNASVFFDEFSKITIYIDDDEFYLGKHDSYDVQIGAIKNFIEKLPEGAFYLDMSDFVNGNENIFARPRS